MAKKISREQLELEVNMLRRYHVSDTIGKLGKPFIQYGFAFLMVWQLSGPIEAIGKSWAGKKTEVDIKVNSTFKSNVNTRTETIDNYSIYLTAAFLGLLFGAGGIVFGIRQAALRKDLIEEHHRLRIKYELSIDPDRTSSDLTSRGETRPEDE